MMRVCTELGHMGKEVLNYSSSTSEKSDVLRNMLCLSRYRLVVLKSKFQLPMDTWMVQVVALCGRLPLALAIAGSMSVVKGRGLNADAWGELLRLFEKNAAKKGRARGDEPVSLNMVFGTSVDALSERKQEELLKTAVLASGAVAPISMLLNLWEIQV